MADRTHNPAEEEFLANFQLVGILAEMIKSALNWDEDHGRDTEDPLQEEGLTQNTRHLDCPSLDKQAEQESSESEDEDGHRNQEQ